MFGFLRPGGSSGARVERMSARDAIPKVSAGEMVLVDVREAMELRSTGRAQGAVHVPMAALRMRCDPSSPECMKEFKQGKAIGIYCASGARSSGAGQMLLQLGHTEVYNLGGFYEWQSSGGKVVR